MSEAPTRGITRKQIEEAIEELVGAGEHPTTTKIRRVLGTGSYTTIGNALQKWREQVAREKPVPTIPKEVEKLFSRLWTAAVENAAAAHENERTGFNTARVDLETANVELLAEVARLESQQESASKENTELHVQLVEKSQQLREMETARARADAELEAQQRQIERLGSDNQRAIEQIAKLSERAAIAETALANDS